METAKPLPPVMLEPVVAASPKRKPSDPPSDNSLRLGKKSSDVSMKLDKTQREDLSQRSEKRETKQPPSDHVVEDAVAMAMAMAVELKTDEAKKILDAETKPEEKDRVKKEKSAPLGEIEVLAKTPEQGSYTLREPVHSPSTGGIRREKEAAFAKLDDDEFEKVLEQENARCAETDVCFLIEYGRIMGNVSEECCESGQEDLEDGLQGKSTGQGSDQGGKRDTRQILLRQNSI